MSEIQINMFEAGNGDSILVKCKGKNQTNLLIDFGYSNTYRKHMEKSLKSMSMEKEVIDLAIITHIDQDHISGGIRFFEDNGPSNKPQVIPVKEVWHNSYKHLDMIETTKELTEKEIKHISKHSIVVEQNREAGTTDTSAKQGSRLAANLKFYGYNWNTSFGGRAVSYRKDPIQLNDEVKITVISPTTNELEKLKKVWKSELKEKFPTIELNDNEIFDDAVECISLMRRPKQIQNFIGYTSSTSNLERLADVSFPEDKDEINGSSITCIVEFNHRKMLFLGDALPSVVEAQIRKIYEGNDFPIYFDAIKIAHHGSARNINEKLLDIIDSQNYLISTNENNSYGHPDIETIAKIIVRKTEKYTRNLYFTNKISKLNIFENEELQQEYRYIMHYRDVNQDSIQICL